MAILAKDTGNNFVPVPAGQYQAVCCDVVDLGMVETDFNGNKEMKHMIRIAFQVNKNNPETGHPYLATKRFTLSLHPKAALRKFLDSWRGRPFSPSDLADGFDVEKLVGVNAHIQVVHTERGWADIQAIMVWKGEDQHKLTVRAYTRVIDREKHNGSNGHGAVPVVELPDVDEVPF